MRRTSLLITLVFMLAAPALAQDYRFRIPEAHVTVTIEEEGSALIHYKLTFECMAGAHPIDIVDIGMPTKRHQPLGAAVDGTPLSDIRKSEYVANAYETHLGGGTIRPGGKGVFEFTARSHDMVWQDTTDPEQASFRFTPTWFGPEYVVGDTQLTVRYRLPIPRDDYPAVKEKILWQKAGEEFSFKGVYEDELMASVAWVRTVSLTGPNMLSVSFPKQYVKDVRRKSIFAMFYEWWADPKTVPVRAVTGFLLVVLFTVAFFLFTGGTGITLFLILGAGLVYGMYASPGFHLLMFPVMPLGTFLVFRWRAKRKKTYFPAELCREGGGIKRGLTAVQAAVLLEVPLHKILTMIIFGLAKKGVLKIVSKNPLRVEITGDLSDFDPDQTRRGIWTLPDGKRVKLWAYEIHFIGAFHKNRGNSVETMKLTKPFDKLIQATGKLMSGFSLEETREYYKRIVARAWKQVKAEGDFEARFQRADRNLDWMMLDNDWQRGMGGLGRGGVSYHPWWWYGTRRGTYSTSGSGGLAGIGHAAAKTVAPTAHTTSFGDVANSLVGRFENASSRIVGSLDGLGTTAKGAVDLSGLDKFTGHMLAEMAKGSGRGGGGGGCACAGCACACACAGGDGNAPLSRRERGGGEGTPRRAPTPSPWPSPRGRGNSMEMTPSKLQQTYRRQAAWFAGERGRLLRRVNIAAKERVLDLGAGSGEILGELDRRARGFAVGADSDPEILRLATGRRCAARAHELPFAEGAFDLVFAQMFFLWARPLEAVIAEIRRVLRPGAHLIAAAEPDYGGVIEHPGAGNVLTTLARELAEEGADVHIGRKLGEALERAGFRVRCGVHPSRPMEAEEAEFAFLPYFHFLATKSL